MRSLNRRDIVLGTIGLGALSFTSSVQAQELLKIGVVSPLTGAGAAWGQSLQGGVELAAQEANTKGGLKVGDKSYQIKIISYDERYTAADAVTAYNRLVNQDGVKFIIGPLSSAGTMAVKELTEDSRALTIVGAYTRKALDANTRFMFRAYATPVEYVRPMVEWLRQNQPESARRVAILNPNDETGWDATELQETSYKANGFQVVGKELYERSLQDFQPLLTRVLAQKPDTIELGTSAPATAGLIVRQARELGFKGRFIKIGGPGPREIAAAAGPAAEGMINFLFADPASDAYKKLASDYRAAKGHEMNELAVPFFDVTRILLAAIQKAGTTTDPDKVRQAMPQVFPIKSLLGETLTLAGKETYGSNTQIMTPSYVGEIKNGLSVVIGIAR